MPTKGFVQGGYYHDKLLAGGGGTDVTVDSPSCIFSSSPVNGVYAQLDFTSARPQDLVCRNLTLNAGLIPVTRQGSTDDLSCQKIICSGDLVLNSGGFISVNGDISDGTYVHMDLSPPGRFFPGSLGGSGGCPGGIGGDGTPTSLAPFQQLFHMGGNGGTGLGALPGVGGHASFFGVDQWGLGQLSNNEFQPSVYQNATVFSFFNENLTRRIVPGPLTVGQIWGGAGGGGCGTGISGPASGGAGGGVCYIACDRLIMNGGTISAQGQNSSTGGGGGGGVIIICCSEIVWKDPNNSIITAIGSNSGIQTGNPGNILLFSNTLVSRFTPWLSFLTYTAALKIYQEQS